MRVPCSPLKISHVSISLGTLTTPTSSQLDLCNEDVRSRVEIDSKDEIEKEIERKWVEGLGCDVCGVEDFITDGVGLQ